MASTSGNTLGGEILAFLKRTHLSRAKAAKVLGFSENYIRSLIDGLDINSGNPFTPREGTLRQLAERMTGFGYPMTFERLRDAAHADGKASVDAAVSGMDANGNSPESLEAADGAITAFARQLVDAPQIDAGLPAALLELSEPPDLEEIAIVRMIGAAEDGPYALKAGVAFWGEPRSARLRRLRFEADEWRDIRAKDHAHASEPPPTKDRPKTAFEKAHKARLDKEQAEREATRADQLREAKGKYEVTGLAATFDGPLTFEPGRKKHDEVDPPFVDD